MRTSTHHLTGAAAAVAVATHTDIGVANAAILIAATTVTAGGTCSPDMDQRRPWRRADRILPDEALGHGGPMRHRGITHWWMIPTAAAFVLCVLGPGGFLWWLAAGGTLGWATHIAGDAIVGARSPQRGPGVPLAPWWWHAGFGARCGGPTEIAISVLLPILAVAQIWA